MQLKQRKHMTVTSTSVNITSNVTLLCPWK
uniref:Uncharacterized protein n=1 Tax=Anguilla anguilla TaxID=7936 RepID=A0A0E9UPF3_ANGAN